MIRCQKCCITIELIEVKELIVVESGVTWRNLQLKLEKLKKKPEKNSYIFSKKSHPKQISYNFLKIFFIFSRPTKADIIKKCFILS